MCKYENNKIMEDILIKADIIDLKLELWLRQRNHNSIVWTTKQGDNIPINQMTDEHLINAIKIIEKIEDRRAFLLELEGDLVNLG